MAALSPGPAQPPARHHALPTKPNRGRLLLNRLFNSRRHVAAVASVKPDLAQIPVVTPELCDLTQRNLLKLRLRDVDLPGQRRVLVAC